MLVKVVPPSVETCHCTVGAGVPVAAAVKLADWPSTTATLAGEVVTVGGESTVRVAADVVTDPMTIMLWGVTTERVQEWASHKDGGLVLNGAAASPGLVEGIARVISSVDGITEVRDGEILVCGSTSPAWAPIFPKVRATVTDVGGVMSHAAIVAREFGVPAVVNTVSATQRLKDGQLVEVDGSAGTVRIIDETSSVV